MYQQESQLALLSLATKENPVLTTAKISWRVTDAKGQVSETHQHLRAPANILANLRRDIVYICTKMLNRTPAPVLLHILLLKKKKEWAEWDMKLLHIKGQSTQVMSENQFFKEMTIRSIFGIQFCNYIQFCCCFSHTHQYSQCGSPSFSGNIHRMENMAISCPSKHLKIQVMIPNYLKILLLV